MVKKLMFLDWAVKRRKVRHQEPQKYDMVWEITTFNLTPGTRKIDMTWEFDSNNFQSNMV